MSAIGRLAPRQRIALRYGRGQTGGAAAPLCVHLHEPSGLDELSVEGVDTEAAMRLLARLIVPASAADAQTPEQLLDTMPAADRDLLLAALHRRCWGDRIVSSLRCGACRAQFDLAFALSALQRHLHERGQEWLDTHPRQGDAPSGGQELAAAQLLNAGCPDQALLALAGPDAQAEALAEYLEHAAPIVDLDLDAPCAECGHAEQIHFDLQSFVLQRLLNERTLLMQEIHVLARGYHWSMSDIVALPRTTRRRLVQMLSTETARA